MMLRTTNGAGTTIHPNKKSGESWGDEKDLAVFVPDGNIPGGDWVCTIEGEHGAVIINNVGELMRLMTALEIAYERAKAANLPHDK